MFAPNKFDDTNLEQHLKSAACDVLAQDHPTETTILDLVRCAS